MPVIAVDMLHGRSEAAKAALARELTDAFQRTCGSARERIYVIIRDVTQENWAVGGEMCTNLPTYAPALEPVPSAAD
ncbi:4-oxalocrotonate tautomerase [Streptosporangium nondiastaticum]|uniref:4-oxalocrotonate tautomerase n=2 Tax=Actinomycetes TaxID=1760 RepID=A0A9X7JNQ6_9ACTN|nr:MULTISPECIES: 2-hydroxymuconate tautomerase [Actinomycetes]PSJ27124.1 4-oxalocrotonate tautomerase [Streptosporangium nondiastaticum]WKU47375.1 2-hydroxymuconate tautomerase [Streptomyces sp. VNUA116]